MSYTVSVSYRDSRGKKHSASYPLDLDIYYGLEGLRAQGIHQISKSLEEIEKTLKGWTGRGKRLDVWTKDEDYNDWAERWQQKRGDDWPTMARPYPAGRPAPTKFSHLKEPRPVRLYWRATKSIRHWHRSKKELSRQRSLDASGRHDLLAIRQEIFGPHLYRSPFARLQSWLKKRRDQDA